GGVGRIRDAFEDHVARGGVGEAVADAADVDQGPPVAVGFEVRVVDVAVRHDVRSRAVAGGLGVREHAQELGLAVVEEHPVVHALRRGVEDADPLAAHQEVVRERQ
ncbi:hypothetical protein ADL26_19635, partial [Thermoactinomyces vulgaris]